MRRVLATLKLRDSQLLILRSEGLSYEETAEILGISYKALLYKIKENGLDKAS